MSPAPRHTRRPSTDTGEQTATDTGEQTATDTGERPATHQRRAGVGSTVVVGNAGDADRPISVRRRRSGRERTDAVTLAPGETRTLAVPEGTGPASVELHARHAAATTTFDPETIRMPPLFAVRERGVVVVQD